MKRGDGRDGNELRPRKIQLGELSRFEGSARFSIGQTVVIASVEGPMAAKASQEVFDSAIVQVSIQNARKTEPAGGGAAKYIVEGKRKEAIQQESAWTTAITRLASWSILLDRYPRCCIEIRVTVLSDDGSVLSAILNATQAAILDSSLLCRGTAFAVTCGFALWGSTVPQLVLDTTNSEEKHLEGFSVLAHGTFAISGDGETVLCEVQDVSAIQTVESWDFDALAFFQMKALATSAAAVIFDLARVCGDQSHATALAPEDHSLQSMGAEVLL